MKLLPTTRSPSAKHIGALDLSPEQLCQLSGSHSSQALSTEECCRGWASIGGRGSCAGQPRGEQSAQYVSSVTPQIQLMFHYPSVTSDSPVKLMVTLATCCSSVWVCNQDLEGSGHRFILHTCAALFPTSRLCPFVPLLPSCPPVPGNFHFQVRATRRVPVCRTVFFPPFKLWLYLEVCLSLLAGYTIHRDGCVVTLGVRRRSS